MLFLCLINAVNELFKVFWPWQPNATFTRAYWHTNLRVARVEHFQNRSNALHLQQWSWKVKPCFCSAVRRGDYHRVSLNLLLVYLMFRWQCFVFEFELVLRKSNLSYFFLFFWIASLDNHFISLFGWFEVELNWKNFASSDFFVYFLFCWQCF